MLRILIFLLFVGLSCQMFDKLNLKGLLTSDRVNAKGMFQTTSIPYSQRIKGREARYSPDENTSPVIDFLLEYFAKNPGLNATESLYKVLDWMYKRCDPEVNSDPETSPDRLKCHQFYSELHYDVINKFGAWLITNNMEYIVQIEYLQFKLLNWGTKIEPELFKDDFCNLSEKEDLEELNYHLIQVVCSVIKKNDTEFVKKLPQLIPEDDETRLQWLGKAEKAIQRMEKYFEDRLDIEKIKKMQSNDAFSFVKKCFDQFVNSMKNNY